jgi:hypothetical protein
MRLDRVSFLSRVWERGKRGRRLVRLVGLVWEWDILCVQCWKIEHMGGILRVLCLFITQLEMGLLSRPLHGSELSIR